jgi:PA14 domain
MRRLRRAEGRREPADGTWGALVLGALLHASLLAFAGAHAPAAALSRLAASSAEVELEIAVQALDRGGTVGPSHVEAPPAPAKLGLKAPELKAKNSIPRPETAKPAVGNTELPDAEDSVLKAPDLFALDQELRADGEALNPMAVQVAAARTRVLRVPPSATSRGAAPEGAAGDNSPTNHAEGSGAAGRGGGSGSGSRLVETPFSFGGPEGAIRAQVCFIPRGTRTVASVGACAVELEFRTPTINITPRRFNEGFPGIPERTEWFAILFTGSFEVRKAGHHHFRLLSDDGSYLVLDGRRVIDNDGVHGPVSKGVNIYLEPGKHNFSVHYFQGPRDLVAVQLFATPPGGAERLLSEQL